MNDKHIWQKMSKPSCLFNFVNFFQTRRANGMALVAKFEKQNKSTLPDFSCLLKLLLKWPTVVPLYSLLLHALSLFLQRTCKMAPAVVAGRIVTQPQSLYILPSISQSKLNQQKAVASVTAGVYQIRTRFYWMRQCHVSVGRKEATDHVRVSPGDSTAIPKLKRRNPVTYDIVFP